MHTWLLPLILVAAAQDPPLGFTAERATSQLEIERRFDAALDPGDLERWMRRLSQHPHHAGSEWGRQNAEWMAEQFRSWGFETRIETYDVLFPTPERRRVELLAPHRFVAKLDEPAIDGVAASRQKDEQLPTYNAFSIDGDVTGELVYVNYGVPEDYEELARHGVDVKGKIVIARYGKSWRGIKPKVAAENGAIGCLIYSDPYEDGYYQGDVYPGGGYRNADSAQRGSVADMPLFPGDPLTPGRAATPDAERLPLDRAPTLTRIPVLPLARADAEPLLAALAGPVAPADWRGALPLTYHVGPGPARVRLDVRFRWNRVKARDVIAEMRGAESPDEWIVRGNHHDAWVNGATDPVSGLVALMAEAQALGRLVESGFRPRRTIVYAAWDAEEPSLLGSVEWVEAHADELRRKAVAYINTDSNGRGFVGLEGSHSLEAFMNQVASAVKDPARGVDVLERRRSMLLVRGDEESKKRAARGGDLPLGALGSGSDYSPFLQHLGIASLNLSFGGEGQYGQYHSSYDSFEHYVRFMDPGFRYGVALAQLAGRATLRLADADVLPFRAVPLVDTIAGYVDEVEKLADERRKKIEEQNRFVREGRFVAAAHPDETYVPPPLEREVPYFNFAPLRNALDELRASAPRLDEAATSAVATGAAEARRALNRALAGLERAMTREQGLPGRPWYTHHVYAPGFYTGYGVKTLPAVREAIEQKRWDEVDGHIATTGTVLSQLAREMSRAASLAAPAKSAD